eukprot:gene7462-603_t
MAPTRPKLLAKQRECETCAGMADSETPDADAPPMEGATEATPAADAPAESPEAALTEGDTPAADPPAEPALLSGDAEPSAEVPSTDDTPPPDVAPSEKPPAAAAPAAEGEAPPAAESEAPAADATPTEVDAPGDAAPADGEPPPVEPAKGAPEGGEPPAQAADSAPTSGDAEPAAQPAEGEPPPPAEGEAPSPAEGEAPPPAEGEFLPPVEGETPPPAEGEVPPPPEAEAPPPAEGEAPPPAEGEAPQPASAEAPPPAEGEAPPPAEGEAPQPAAAEAPPPAEGEAPPPAEGEAPQPAAAETPPPAEGEAPASSSRPASAAPPAEGEAPAAEPPPSEVVGEPEAEAGSKPSSRPASVAPPPPSAVVGEPGPAGSRPVSQPESAAPLELQEPSKPKFDADTVYNPQSFKSLPDPEKEYDAGDLATENILSLDALKRGNICFIEEDVLMTAAGCNVVFLKLPNMEQEFLPGLDGGGIGALAVHPSRKFFAVAEKCRYHNPNIYIYTYPTKTLVRAMRLGTERAYSALAFNDRGDMLASVGSYPDFLLTLWNWDEEGIILRTKAFSQEVYNVRFSPYLEGILHTCGTGHIRFWKMADTFTGLKLQGQLGKFGNVELSDIAAFVEMPDGKVLSGSERGELLMWDGGLIKVVLTRKDGKSCHDGNIQVLMHERTSNTIISGGADGYVRLWDFAAVNDAEPEEDAHDFAIQPALLWERRRWIVFDEAGGIFMVNVSDQGTLAKTATVSNLLKFHSGGIVGMVSSPTNHIAFTAGMDGSVRVFDYEAKKLIETEIFNCPATVAIPQDAKAWVMLVGFKDGVVRAVQRCHDGLRLVAAVKPNKGAITALAISKDGRRLATAGEEGTIFVFEITKPATFEPVGSFPVPGGPATCLNWSPDCKSLLCGTRTGAVMEMTPPELGEVDTNKTFELGDVPSRLYNFKLPKPPKKKKKKGVKDGEGAAEEGKEGDKADAKGDGDSATPEGGDGGGEDGEKKEGEEEEEEEEEEVHEEAEQFEVITINYDANDPGAFLMTLGGKASATVWHCRWDVPDVPLVYMPGFANASTTYLKFQTSGDTPYLLMGSADGVVRMQPTSGPCGPPAGKMWQIPTHDMIDGQVSSAFISWDGAYMLSAGHDGTIHLKEMRLNGGKPVHKESPLENMKTLELAPPTAEDILNPNEYTLEEAKQKAEQDAILAAAEAKKMDVREFLGQIRTEFEALLSENKAKPEAEKLSRSDFEIDPGLREMIEEETRQREEVARLELAWETEKRRLALAKLKGHFLDNVEVERIVLHSLWSKQYITSFRTAKLSPEVIAELEAAQEAVKNGVGAGKKSGEGGGAASGEGSAANTGGAEGMSIQLNEAGGIASTGGGTGVHTADTSKMTKADLRRQARKKRESDWAGFNATKPDDKYENPTDVAEIEEAERNMGDFKLKSDPKYVIPEEERMTPQRKRQQMLLLEGSMHSVRMDFNRRFLALREVKKKVIAEINAKLLRLKEIRENLTILGASPDDEKHSEYFLRFEEMPENRELVTDEELEDYASRKAEDEKAKAAKEAGGGGMGFGGGGGAAAPKKEKSVPRASAKSIAAGATSVPDASVPVSAEDALTKMMAAGPQSELERNLAQYQRNRMEFMQTTLRNEIDEMVEAFDSALSTLRREKFQLEADLKLGEIKMLVHYQELTLLHDFDKREILLIQKRQTKLDDRQEIVDKITDCNEKLEQKKRELEGLISRRAVVVADFDSCVPETDPFREQLFKIFLKKIKRSKKKAKDEGDGESDEDEDGEEDDEEMDEDDDGEEVCPSGCDQGLYERVCDLRERRLDEEDLISEFQKATEALRKEKETHAKKQRLVEQTLATIQQDITEFQKEKQGRLNQIDVVVNLRMHQIEYLVDGRLPEDLSQGLVFSNVELQRLKRRIDELEQEKADLKARQKGLKKEHLQLLRDKRAKDDKVSEMERKAYDVQMLKFGQVIDMDLLDRVGSTRGTEELREELKKQEAKYARELAECDRKIAARTDELMALTRENTSCLNAVSDLTVAQRQLEGALTATHNTMFSDPALNRKQEVEERDQLVQLVNAQASEIDKLKAQIGALRRKDTSVYG